VPRIVEVTPGVPVTQASATCAIEALCASAISPAHRARVVPFVRCRTTRR
jgi:hypothetical protein